MVRDRVLLDKLYVTVCNQASSIRSYIIGASSVGSYIIRQVVERSVVQVVCADVWSDKRRKTVRGRARCANY